jgi:glycosyltransferase involved in cell wall biosynthesis
LDSQIKSKYRILLVIRWPVGGIRTFIRYVYNNFNQSSYHFTIIAPDIPELRVMLEDLSQLDPTYIPFKDGSSNLRLIALLTKTILFGKFDLIHSHGFTAAILSVLPACIGRTKHIMTSHDVFLPKQFEGLRGMVKKRALSVLLPMVDVIHCVGKDAQNNLLKFIPGVSKRSKKCVAISNGIEVRRFEGSEKRDFREELSLNGETYLIGFLGRFMSQKGFVYLIESLELLLKKQRLEKRPVIVAFGSGGFVREDREYIHKKGLENYFHFLPFASNVAPSLKGLDVVVMPSLWEACSLLPMEVMVSGTPFIGTDCIGLRETLINTPSVMVPAGNSVLLARALEQEMKNPSRSKAEAFRNQAARRFDVVRQAKELEKLTLNLINQK